jgi:hypothetical protein
LVTPATQDRLAEKGVRPIDAWDKKDLYWAVITDCVVKKTKKGKDYLLFKLMGVGGKDVKCFCWGWKGDKMYVPNTPIVLELEKGDFGFSTQAWRVREIK